MQYIIGFFNPVIPTQDFELFHNPDSYFWHPTSLVIFQSRIAPWFCFKIPNPELQIRVISDPGNLIMTLYTIVHFSWLTNVAAPVTQQVVNCWTESSLSLMILIFNRVQNVMIHCSLLINKCETDCATGTIANVLYLTIIPRVRFGYEFAIILSYPTSASGIIVLLKTLTKYREFFPTLFVKQPIFSLFLILSRRE